MGFDTIEINLVNLALSLNPPSDYGWSPSHPSKIEKIIVFDTYKQNISF